MNLLLKSKLPSFAKNIRKTHTEFIKRFYRSIGIVGMPNVGKSTLFNAITKTQNAQAENYPFCTINPNISKVAVPDDRLYKLADLASSRKVIESQLEFVDIAGLVRGASKGAGLGNKFLDNIRQVSVIAHVLRCFEDPDIIHVEETIDPIRDMEIIRSELILADLAAVEKRLNNLCRKIRSGDNEAIKLKKVLEKILEQLENEQVASTIEFDDEEDLKITQSLNLLTAKKNLFICNVSEDDASSGNEMTEKIVEQVSCDGSECLIVSASLEEAAACFEDTGNQLEYLSCYGLKETGLSKVIKSCRDLLQLQTFYTIGENEARSWNIPIGIKAPEAAGQIHSDFEKFFIRAETISYDDYVACGSEKIAKEKGLMRIEGKEYVCKDGDIFHFLIGK